MISGNSFEHSLWVLTFCINLPETFLTLREIQLFIINVHRPSRQVSITFVAFYPNLNFLDRFFKNIQMSNFIKIRPLGDEFFRADGRMDGQTDVMQ